MKMKYSIGESVMVLKTQKIHKIVAIDSEALWYRLNNDSNHYTQEELASKDEVIYALIIHDSLSQEYSHSIFLFKDWLKADCRMQDLYEEFKNLDLNDFIKKYYDGRAFYIYNSKNSLERYSCEIQAVKITD